MNNCDTGHILSSYSNIILCVVNVCKQRVLIYFSYPPLNISITRNIWSLYDVHGTRPIITHCFSLAGIFSVWRRDFLLTVYLSRVVNLWRRLSWEIVNSRWTFMRHKIVWRYLVVCEEFEIQYLLKSIRMQLDIWWRWLRVKMKICIVSKYLFLR